jgi:ubiquinone/menaquinone biosynthesis C-methylase UbiE
VTTSPDSTPSPDTTPSPDNPFDAADVGEIYRRGRPYHHPRSLARVRALVGDEGARVDRALDVACGTGMSTTALAEFAQLVVGLDISPEMLRVVPPAPNVSYMLGSAERMPFADGAFDAVTCSSGIHWFDQDRFYGELRRVVRPGGWIGVYDHYFSRMHDVAEFDDWVRELFRRYPLPPRNAQVGELTSEQPDGFEILDAETFDDPIEMTHGDFADYQLTISGAVAAVERGIPRQEIRAWLLESTAPLFADASTRVLHFIGVITCLRRLP